MGKPAKPFGTSTNAWGTTKKGLNHGWYMLVHPASQRILCAQPMDDPENNAVVTRALVRIIRTYARVDTSVYDRCCRYVQAGRKVAALNQIKTWAVDRLHGFKHKRTCPCSPYNKRGIKRRLAGVNTSAAEQVFAGFRCYASTFISMSRERHWF